MLLIVGGSKDHNLQRLAEAAAWRKVPHRVIFTDAEPAPTVDWRPGAADICINGETFSAKGTSLFIRYDVFGKNAAPRKAAFYEALRGWANACPEVAMLNRGNENLEMSKPRALVLAQECGFATPQTWITSIFNQFAEKDKYIAKPVAGGEYTKQLSDMPEQSDRPWIVQEKLRYPELRLFRAGKHYLAFEITSEVLDYRTTDKFTMKEVEPPKELLAAMEKLTAKLGLDYAAADLKTNPRTGALEFLEINSMPMFTGYDNAAQGRLSDAILLALDGLKTRKPRRATPEP